MFIFISVLLCVYVDYVVQINNSPFEARSRQKTIFYLQTHFQFLLVPVEILVEYFSRKQNRYNNKNKCA